MSAIATTHPQPSRRDPERGASLIFALLGLAVLTILGLGLTSIGMVATKTTTNERDTAEAIALADAGIAHARKMISYQEWPWDTMTNFLNAGDGIACTGDELIAEPPGAPNPYPDLFIAPAAAGGNTVGNGSYRVYVCDDHLTDVNPQTGVLDNNPNADVNRRIIVRAVGITDTGATAQVEQIYGSDSVPALLVNGNLSIRGDSRVSGSAGVIHSNGAMDIVGNSVCAEQLFSSTQQITGGIPEGGANCDQDGETRPGAAPRNVRVIAPSDYKDRAKYWFSTVIVPAGGGGGGGGNGGGGGGGGNQLAPRIYQNTNYNPAGGTQPAWTVMAAPPPGWAWNNFNANGYRWSVNNSVEETVYYFDTHLSLGGNVGNGAAPLSVTFLVEGSVSVQGGAKITGRLSIPRIGAIAIVSGQDLDMAGNAGSTAVTYTGLFYARHQIELSGTPYIEGQVIALNAADTFFPTPPPVNNVNTSNPVPLVNGYMRVSGNPHIRFNGGGLENVSPVTWRECRLDAVGAPGGFAGDTCGSLSGVSWNP